MFLEGDKSEENGGDDSVGNDDGDKDFGDTEEEKRSRENNGDDRGDICRAEAVMKDDAFEKTIEEKKAKRKNDRNEEMGEQVLELDGEKIRYEIVVMGEDVENGGAGEAGDGEREELGRRGEGFWFLGWRRVYHNCIIAC